MRVDGETETALGTLGQGKDGFSFYPTHDSVMDVRECEPEGMIQGKTWAAVRDQLAGYVIRSEESEEIRSLRSEARAEFRGGNMIGGH
jgi:hypothetical protein